MSNERGLFAFLGSGFAHNNRLFQIMDTWQNKFPGSVKTYQKGKRLITVSLTLLRNAFANPILALRARSLSMISFLRTSCPNLGS